MSNYFTEIQVRFVDSPVVEIQPIRKGSLAVREKRKNSWFGWFQSFK